MPTSSDKKTILIVEDEDLLRDMLAKKLSRAGFRVDTAENGEEALTRIRKEKPDLLVLDIVMPKMDGFELMERLNKTNAMPLTIVISNSGDIIDTKRARALGAKKCIVKTEFDPEDVLTLAKKYLKSSARKTRKKSNTHIQKPADSPEHKKMVLVIEDDEFIQRLLVKKLKQEGFVVTCAQAADAALTQLKKELVDLIFLDLVLPGLSGFEFIVKAQKDADIKKFPLSFFQTLVRRQK